MNNSGDLNVQNFKSIIEKYESIIQDVTKELGVVQVEQANIRGVLKENCLLSAELNKVLAEKTSSEVDHKFQESGLIENLKLQLKAVINEKEHVMKLWQNASATVDYLEGELKTYQENTEGLIPKSKLLELQEAYESKLNQLQNTVASTKSKLEELVYLRAEELKAKDKEIIGSVHSQDNSFKIIQNLEKEVLSLQYRLSEVSGDKNQLEKTINSKKDEIELLKGKVKECRIKVEEALQIVEAALNEKDAALLRETETKEEIVRLSKSLAELVEETDAKVKQIKGEHTQKLKEILNELRDSQEEVKNYSKKCQSLEEEVERLHKGHVHPEDYNTSKLLTLEKNLENTFQKLLLSEKQNIQLKAEVQNIKQDLDQMAQYYERDINAREAEKNVLREEIKNLKSALGESNLKATESAEVVNILSAKVSQMESSFNEELESVQKKSTLEREEMEETYKETIEELKIQLLQRNEINRKWRIEAKHMTDCLEKRILELRLALNKVKIENRTLTGKLKDANLKMYEYRKFLQMISQDVNKITSMTLPDLGESNR